MLWAAICTGFFGIGEFTSPSATHYDPSIHLSFKDISVDDLSNTQVVTLAIKQSKTDQLKNSHKVCLTRRCDDLCPVAALLAYVAVRGDRAGPLFVLEDGRFLTPSINLRDVLSSFGLDPSN